MDNFFPITVIIWLISIAIGVGLANKKGIKSSTGFLLTFFFSWIGLIILAIMKNKNLQKTT